MDKVWECRHFFVNRPMHRPNAECSQPNLVGRDDEQMKEHRSVRLQYSTSVQ